VAGWEPAGEAVVGCTVTGVVAVGEGLIAGASAVPEVGGGGESDGEATAGDPSGEVVTG
jgi:hypothetical protein